MSINYPQLLAPKSWDEVKFQPAAVQTMQSWLASEAIPSFISIFGGSGTGKEQPISEPVLTPGGWSTMGQLKINDYVIGSNGFPTKVVGVYPQGQKEVYTITTYEGIEIRCGKDHLWGVDVLQSGKRKRVVKTTLELAYRLKPYKYSLPLFAGVQNGLTVDYAYALGYVLAKGSLSQNVLKVCFPTDAEEKLLNLLESTLGLPYRINPGVTTNSVAFYSWAKIHPEIAKYRSKGSSAKRTLIFNDLNYLSWNYKSRLDLLQGLLDGDGCSQKQGAAANYSFCSTSVELIKLVTDLTRSLGGRCSKPGLKNNPRGYSCGYCGIVHIIMPVNPFKVKSYLWKLSKSRPTSCIKAIVKEDYLEESVCIRVEAEDSLYVTTGYKLTHNTSIIKLLIQTTHCLNREPHQIDNCGKCAVCQSDPQLSSSYSNVVWVAAESVKDADGKEVTYQRSIVEALHLADRGPTYTGFPHRDVLYVVFEEAHLLPKDLIQRCLARADASNPYNPQVVLVFLSMSPEEMASRTRQAISQRGSILELASPTVAQITQLLVDKFKLDLEPAATIASSCNHSIRGAYSAYKDCLDFNPKITVESIQLKLRYVNRSERNLIWGAIVARKSPTEFKKAVDGVIQSGDNLPLVKLLQQDLDEKYDCLGEDLWWTATKLIGQYIINPKSISLTYLLLNLRALNWPLAFYNESIIANSKPSNIAVRLLTESWEDLYN